MVVVSTHPDQDFTGWSPIPVKPKMLREEERTPKIDAEIPLTREEEG